MGKASRASKSTADPTMYPVSDEMGENTVELNIRLFLVPLLRRYLEQKGLSYFVGSNQFIYWEQHTPTRSVAPDVYVVPSLAPDAQFGCIKTWEASPPTVPSFALEVVSENRAKDYERAPLRYDALGVKELVVFDPKHEQRREGRRWQVWRRVARRGLVLVEVSDEDRVRSKGLGCYLREVTAGSSVLIRLGLGASGEELVPTAEEAERAARERAEAELQRLRARLASGKPPRAKRGLAQGRARPAGAPRQRSSWREGAWPSPRQRAMRMKVQAVPRKRASFETPPRLA